MFFSLDVKIYLGEQYQIKRCNNNFVAAIKFLVLLGLSNISYICSETLFIMLLYF